MSNLHCFALLSRQACVSLVLCTITPAAQTTWVVDDDPLPGVHFNDIQPAVDAAAPGDLVLVRDGAYGAVVDIHRALRLICSKHAHLDSGSPGFPPGGLVRIHDVPAGEVVVLRGLDRHRFEVWDCAGTVVLDSFDVRSFSGVAPTNWTIGYESWSSVWSCSDVRIRGRRLASIDSSRVEWVQALDGSALNVHGASLVHAVAAQLVGPDGNGPPTHNPGGFADPGVPAISVNASGPPASARLILARCQLQGGDGGYSPYCACYDGQGAPALSLCRGTLRSSESTLIGGRTGGTGSPVPSVSLGCGAVTDGPVNRVDPTLQVEGPAIPGTDLLLRVTGTPGDVVRLLIGAAPARAAVPGSAIERLVAPTHVLSLGVISTQGDLYTYYPISLSQSVGSIEFLQAFVVGATGQGHASNSLPLVVGLPDGSASAGIGIVGCEGEPNSTGAPAALYASGSLRLQDNSLQLDVADLPPATAVLFICSQTPGTSMIPGSAGILCLAGVIGRFGGPGQVQLSSNLGRARLAVDLTQLPEPSGGFVTVAPGEVWYFQAWYRDVVPTVTASNFSSSVAVSFY